MLEKGTKIKIINAGCGAEGCNGHVGTVIETCDETMEGHGLPESDPHIKILLHRNVYPQNPKREVWRVNLPENGLKYEIYDWKLVLTELFTLGKWQNLYKHLGLLFSRITAFWHKDNF